MTEADQSDRQMLVLTTAEMDYLAAALDTEIVANFSAQGILEFLGKLASAGVPELAMPFLRTIEKVIVDARRHTNQAIYDATLGMDVDDSHE